MIYHVCTALMLIGILGLVAQVLLGGAHAGHTGHSGDAGGHGAGGHGGGHDGPVGHAGDVLVIGAHGVAGGGRQPGHRVNRGSFLLTLLSPVVFFSLCIGAGGTGLLVKHFHFPATIVVFIALAGGALFYSLLIGPLWSLVFKFASNPSTALEGAIAHEAEAVTAFNADGKGLVKLTVDGQFIQVLATLEPDDLEDARKIVRGDRLTVTSVDGHANTCRVARL